MTTTPQAALLSEAAKLADEFRVTMPREVFAIWGAEVQAELRRLDALVAHLTADRDDTANELALRTKHNLALTTERDQLLAKLQATQAEPTIPGLTKEQFGYALHCAQVVDAATSEIARLRSENAVLNERLDATQEPVQSVPEAMKVVTEAVRSDPDYAWSWHCSVAMASVDEGMGHYEANQAAARFMRLLAGVDTTKHQGFPEAPKKEPVQAGELLLQGGLTNEQLREAFGEKMPGVVPSDRDLTLFALGLEVGAAELADERRMKKMYFDERNSARDAWRRAADQREEARSAPSASGGKS